MLVCYGSPVHAFRPALRAKNTLHYARITAVLCCVPSSLKSKEHAALRTDHSGLMFYMHDMSQYLLAARAKKRQGTADR